MGDLGHLPEPQLIKRLWPPDAIQPTAAAPELSVAPADDGRLQVTIVCATEGASIAYRRDTGRNSLLA